MPPDHNREYMMNRKEKPAWWQAWRWELHWQILLGLLVGGLIGWLLAQVAIKQTPDGKSANEWIQGNSLRLICDAVGTVFLNGLKVIVIPLVTSSIIVSVAVIGRRPGFARLGIKTLVYFGLTSTLAILLGLLLVNLFKPGVSKTGEPLMDPAAMASFQESFASESKSLNESLQKENTKSGESLLEKVLSIFKRLVPSNPVQAMVEMDLLGLIVLCLITGYFVSFLPDELRETMMKFWQGVYEISFSVTNLVLRFAPLGIAGLLGNTVSMNYVKLASDGRINEFIGALTVFGLVAAAALLIHLLIVLPAVLWAFTRLNPLQVFRAISPALLTAFSTSSSNATISVSLDCVENRAGVSKEVSSFIIPVGATVNMNGTALYECVAAIFVVQLFGIHQQLEFAEQLMIVLIALLTSVGVAGVPSASLVAIVIILDSVTRQLKLGFELADALPILLILDRPLDMMRTAVNVAGDNIGAILIGKTEGETLFAKDNHQSSD
jgi:DAACS family dicarboxylate/amino acid:cation (Na+ or H+) symporter